MHIMDKHIAIIPLRKGSKGITGKNRKKLLGRPLYSWVLHEALESNLSKVYLYTDDQEIILQASEEYRQSGKLKIIEREPADATDTATTESAMIAFVAKIDSDFDTITLLQATSPLTRCEDINASIRKIESGKCDSVISFVEEKRFIWDREGNSINYDYKNRPRRQDFEGLLVENGAIYTTLKQQFQDSGLRIGGRIDHILMPADAYFEVDEEEDFVVIESLLRRRLMKQKGGSSEIKALVLDVDGVLTDGTVAYGSEGEVFKVFSMRDGMGLEILREHGIQLVVITAEDSDIVKSRMKKLKIKNAFYGVKDKYTCLSHILDGLKLSRHEVAYIGDDRNDLANILSCGWGIVPNDAVEEVLSGADIKLNSKGGKMAVREAVNFILNFNKRSQ